MRKFFNFNSLFPKPLLHSKIYIYLGATPGDLIFFILFAKVSHPLILFKKITHKHQKHKCTYLAPQVPTSRNNQ